MEIIIIIQRWIRFHWIVYIVSCALLPISIFKKTKLTYCFLTTVYVFIQTCVCCLLYFNNFYANPDINSTCTHIYWISKLRCMSCVNILNHICYNFLVFLWNILLSEGKHWTKRNYEGKDTGMLKFENLQIQSFSSVHCFQTLGCESIEIP